MSLRWPLLAAVVLTGLFQLWPGIDLWVSGQFYSADAGFALAGDPALQLLRSLLWNAATLVALASALALGLSAFLGASARVSPRIWAFATLMFVLGPGLIVNGILKTFWGRARPRDIEAFGGNLQFTPPVGLTDECARNCSFVSGEAASAVTLAIVIGVLLWHRLPQGAIRRGIVALLVLLALTGSGLRVAMGGHFLSDVLFAALIVWALALGLARALDLGGALGSLSRANVATDLRGLAARITRRV